jgi:hypothetical protein
MKTTKQLKITRMAPSQNYIEPNILLVGGVFDGQRVTIHNKAENVFYKAPGPNNDALVEYTRVAIEDQWGQSAVFYKYSRLNEVAAVKQLLYCYKK